MIKNTAGKISFYYGDATGQPITGASLVAIIRGDYGAWVPASSVPTESSPSVAAGVYDLTFSASETNFDHVDWYVKTATNTFVNSGQFDTEVEGQTTADLVFQTIFGTPTDSADLATRSAFLNSLADHVLRRGQGSAEGSSYGDNVGPNSLLGVISLLTQGQMVVTDCNGEAFIFLNSAIQGNGPIGALRVVKNTSGVPIGVLPLCGPNAAPCDSVDAICES